MGLIEHYRLIRELLFFHFSISPSSVICGDVLQSANHKLEPYQNINLSMDRLNLKRTDCESFSITATGSQDHLYVPLTIHDQNRCTKNLDS